jgi:hypothetical protein
MKPTPCSIHVPLHEHQTGGMDFSTWPQDVQNIHTRELNPDLDIVKQVHSIDPVRRVTVTEWDYVAKAVAA